MDPQFKEFIRTLREPKVETFEILRRTYLYHGLAANRHINKIRVLLPIHRAIVDDIECCRYS
jgi:hypothetical protein